ncbi:hypothetical protein MNV49_004507 [Pseudohyphozyma bogoriensis]|nr:hypothetical protein MNV49_004507 [Pseudohyphozyma bogoriensis]
MRTRSQAKYLNRPLPPLPAELWIHILSLLPPDDSSTLKTILAFRRVSKPLARLTHDNSLWRELVYHHWDFYSTPREDRPQNAEDEFRKRVANERTAQELIHAVAEAESGRGALLAQVAELGVGVIQKLRNVYSDAFVKQFDVWLGVRYFAYIAAEAVGRRRALTEWVALAMSGDADPWRMVCSFSAYYQVSCQTLAHLDRIKALDPLGNAKEDLTTTSPLSTIVNTVWLAILRAGLVGDARDPRSIFPCALRFVKDGDWHPSGEIAANFTTAVILHVLLEKLPSTYEITSAFYAHHLRLLLVASRQAEHVYFDQSTMTVRPLSDLDLTIDDVTPATNLDMLCAFSDHIEATTPDHGLPLLIRAAGAQARAICRLMGRSPLHLPLPSPELWLSAMPFDRPLLAAAFAPLPESEEKAAVMEFLMGGGDPVDDEVVPEVFEKESRKLGEVVLLNGELLALIGYDREVDENEGGPATVRYIVQSTGDGIQSPGPVPVASPVQIIARDDFDRARRIRNVDNFIMERAVAWGRNFDRFERGRLVPNARLRARYPGQT